MDHVNSIPAYLCDPQKNKNCKKRSCFIYNGGCYMTLKEENAIDNGGVFRYINNPQKEEKE